MDLQPVKTVQDLVELNKSPETLLQTRVDEMEGEQVYQLVLELIARLGTWHEVVVEQLIEAGHPAQAMEWRVDEMRLEQAHALITRVSQEF